MITFFFVCSFLCLLYGVRGIGTHTSQELKELPVFMILIVFFTTIGGFLGTLICGFLLCYKYLP